MEGSGEERSREGGERSRGGGGRSRKGSEKVEDVNGRNRRRKVRGRQRTVEESI